MDSELEALAFLAFIGTSKNGKSLIGRLLFWLLIIEPLLAWERDKSGFRKWMAEHNPKTHSTTASPTATPADSGTPSEATEPSKRTRPGSKSPRTCAEWCDCEKCWDMCPHYCIKNCCGGEFC